MYSVYRALVFIHVISILAFLLTHGAALTAVFALKRERRPERVAALANLSLQTMAGTSGAGVVLLVVFLVLPISGVALMVMGAWWREGWAWASIVVFIAIIAVMTAWGRMPMNEVRRTSALPDAAGMEVALAGLRPSRLLAAGGGGFAVLAWLMMYKPF